ncbi:PKD domain-containing protein [Candidatus Saccharibacteria bacterium]|nr:PKD domain-containing protein [Candidatus Saccharibacteria bacterium]
MLFRDVVSNISLGRNNKNGLAFYVKRLSQEQTSRNLTAFLAVVVVIFQAFTFIAPPQPSEASAGSANDIIYGGYSSKADLLNKYNNNLELRSIFLMAGIGYDQLNSATYKTVNSNENVYSMGRIQHGDPSVNIKVDVPNAQSNIYLRPLNVWGANKTFSGLSGTNARGEQFWILSDCGNPVIRISTEKPPKPTTAPPTTAPPTTVPPTSVPPTTPPPTKLYTCDSLQANPTSGKLPLEVAFTATKTVQNTTFLGFIYEFGDGATTESTEPNITHTYTRAGNYTAKVRVKTNDGTTSYVAACQATVTVAATPPPAPRYSCDKLNATPDAANPKFTAPLTVLFRVDKTIENTTFQKLLFDFGDGETATTSTEPVMHVYKKTGEYKAKVRVQTSSGTTEYSDACSATITVTEPSLAYQKQAVNLTLKDSLGKPTNANGTTVQAGNEIKYSLTVSNQGTAKYNEFIFEENIADIVEYADIIDTGGGKIVNRPIVGQEKLIVKTLVWDPVSIEKGQSVSKSFTVRVKNPIPATPTGKSDKNSFDLQMENIFFNNRVVINLPVPPVKQPEIIIQQMPQTGAGVANTALAFFASGAVFILLRNRLMKKELEILATSGQGV